MKISVDNSHFYSGNRVYLYYATGSFLPKTIVAVVLVETLLCLGSSVSTPACTSVSSRSFSAQQLTVGWPRLRWKIPFLGSSVIPTWSGRGGGSTGRIFPAFWRSSKIGSIEASLKE